jgi:hypothetical protein
VSSGYPLRMIDILDQGGHLCAGDLPLAEATRALDAQQLTAARSRGAALTLAAAVEFAVIMAGEEAPQTPASVARSGLARLRAAAAAART